MIFITHSMNGYIEHICPEYSSEFTVVISNLGTFGVEIFFFLSGFVIYLASIRTPGKEFFSHRFWRIYPVFILFTLFYFILNHFIQVTPEKDNIFYLLLHIFFINVFFETPPLTPNAWTVVLEIWYYMATFFIVSYWVRERKSILLIIGICLTVYLLIFWPITLFYVTGVIASIFISRYRQYINNLGKLTVNLIQILALFIMMFIIATKNYNNYTWNLIMTDFNIILLFITLFIVMILMYSEDSLLVSLLSKKIFLILGTVSYTLYLAHPYSYIVARKLTEHFIIAEYSHEMSITIFSILLFLFTFFLVWFIHVFVEAKIYKKMTGKKLLIPVAKIK